MPFVLTFSPSNFSLESYSEAIEKLKAAGAGAPKRRTYHVCYGDPDGVTVTDVWDSMEDFEEFGKTLVPIMHELGADPGEPDIQEVNNVIIGK